MRRSNCKFAPVDGRWNVLYRAAEGLSTALRGGSHKKNPECVKKGRLTMTDILSVDPNSNGINDFLFQRYNRKKHLDCSKHL